MIEIVQRDGIIPKLAKDEGGQTIFDGKKYVYLSSNDQPILPSDFTENAKSIPYYNDGSVVAVAGGLDAALNFYTLTRRPEDQKKLVLVDINKAQLIINRWKLDLIATSPKFSDFLLRFLPFSQKEIQNIKSRTYQNERELEEEILTRQMYTEHNTIENISGSVWELGYPPEIVDLIVETVSISRQIKSYRTKGISYASGEVYGPYVDSAMLYQHSEFFDPKAFWHSGENFERTKKALSENRVHLVHSSIQEFYNEDFFKQMLPIRGFFLSNAAQYFNRKSFNPFINSLKRLPNRDEILIGYNVDMGNNYKKRVITFPEYSKYSPEIHCNFPSHVGKLELKAS